MKIYLLTNRQGGSWDTYSSAVVYAESKEEAKMVHPRDMVWNGKDKDSWCDAEEVEVTLLGETTEAALAGTVLCTSFHAG